MYDVPPPQYENRRFTRVSVKHPVKVSVFDDEFINGWIQDMSARGLSANFSESLGIGLACTVIIPIEPGKDIEIEGGIVHVIKNRHAIEFLSMKSTSYPIMMEFLLKHAEDPSILEEEFATLTEFLPRMD